MAPPAATERQDPLPTFCFKVELEFANRRGEAFFKSVGGLKYEAEIVDYREGGLNDRSRKLMGVTKWANLVLKRGFTGSSELLDWRTEWLKPTGGRDRLKGTIIQLSTDLKEVCRWTFDRGIPVKWEVGDFDASKSEVSIETLEIAHEGLEFSKGG